MKFFSHPEGYVDTENGNKYVYQYKDHLGNIRLSYLNIGTTGSPNLEIQEENNYYPFGLKHKGYNNVVIGAEHPFDYQGKENQKELGLNWHDFGARNYNVTLGRWMNIDPLAERYTNYTPYNYVANTPLQAIDPDGRAIIFIGGLRLSAAENDQDWKTNYVSSNIKPWIYERDVFNYWSTDKNSFGSRARIDRMFMDAYQDNRAYYLSGSSAFKSNADRRQREGAQKAKLFHKYFGYGSKKTKLEKGEAIRVVSHSQGGAHAAGFVEQLLKYKDENGGNLYNVEIIYYLNPHQPGDINNPNGVEAIQYSVTTDQISGNGLLSALGLNGGSEYEEIEGAEHYYMSVFPVGQVGTWFGRRGGHNVTDGQQNILKILNEFCEKNPSKCQEIKLKEKN